VSNCPRKLILLKNCEIQTLISGNSVFTSVFLFLKLPKIVYVTCCYLEIICFTTMRKFLVTSFLSSVQNNLLVQSKRHLASNSKICALIVGKILNKYVFFENYFNTYILIIIGAPGSGKGTISNWIVRDFGLKHVSSGDLLRQHINDNTPLGREAKQFIDKGALVPDQTMVNLIASELKQLAAEPWLLDGFPRTQAQAKALQDETPVNVVINLDVPFETIIDRVKGKGTKRSRFFYKNSLIICLCRSLGSSRIWTDL
jgi:adenylate kinase family enzyme